MLHFFPLSGTIAWERVHISVIQAQWDVHQQQQCYANPVDSFHLSSLCFFPFSSPSFLLTFAEDPAITLLGYQVQSKMLNNQTTQCITGKNKALYLMRMIVSFVSELCSKNTNLTLFPVWFAYHFQHFPLQRSAASSPNLVTNPEAEITAWQFSKWLFVAVCACSEVDAQGALAVKRQEGRRWGGHSPWLLSLHSKL